MTVTFYNIVRVLLISYMTRSYHIVLKGYNNNNTQLIVSKMFNVLCRFVRESESDIYMITSQGQF